LIVFGRKRVIVLLILELMIVGILGVYYYPKIQKKGLTIKEVLDNEPPIVKELNWKPTREINDKVY